MSSCDYRINAEKGEKSNELTAVHNQLVKCEY